MSQSCAAFSKWALFFSALPCFSECRSSAFAQTPNFIDKQQGRCLRTRASILWTGYIEIPVAYSGSGLSKGGALDPQVLEGYVYLGNVGSLGEDVMAAFAAVVGIAALKVARGVVLKRPVPGLEERVKSTQLLQELVKFVPPDLFRTCLTRVRLSTAAIVILLEEQ